jgi:hypothetical protein
MESGFDSFWSAYPRKVGKRDAMKAWKQTKAEHPPVLDLLVALGRMCRSRQWTRDGGQYIPYPATWLRRGGWDDQPDSETAVVSRPDDVYRGVIY